MNQYFRLCCISFLITIFCHTDLTARVGKLYSSDSEISNSLINNVYQDHRGFVWISTEDGLQRFDGNHFTVYKQQKNSEGGLANSYVRKVFEDSKGNFWVLCLNAVQLYNKDYDKFITIPLDTANPTMLHTNSIIELRNGEIWLSTLGQGIMRLKEDKFVTIASINAQTGSVFTSLIYEDNKGMIWINTEDKGLVLYNPERESVQHFTAPEHLTSESVSSICEDQQGTLFVSAINGGLMKFDREKNIFEPILYHNNATLSIKCLYVGRQNQLFIGTEGMGLKLYDREQNSIVDCDINIGVVNLASSKIHSILEDKDNNLWLGIFYKGLLFIPAMQNKFNYFGYKSFNHNCIGSDYITSIIKDKKDIIWIGTDNDGLYAIDDDGRQLKHFKRKHVAGSAPLNVTCMLEDSSGQFWVGSYFNGLSLLNRSTGACTPVAVLSEREKNKRYASIYCLYEDAQKHIWVGTYGSGIYKMNQSQEIISQYRSDKTGVDNWASDRLCNDWVNCIYQDKEGLIWIGTANGLSCYNPKKDTFINFFGMNNLLPNLFVHAIKQGKDGKIRIGTSEGLYAFDKSSSTFTITTTADGLPSNVICGIVEDDEGDLWISTHKGISKHPAGTNSFINYYASDGLQGNEFARGAYFKDKEGRIYFAGTNGITSFYPHEIAMQRKQLHVVITDFKLGSQSIKKGDRANGVLITDTFVMDETRFSIPYNHNTFHVELSTMNYSSPEKFVYRYKIKELNKNWSNTSQGVNTITYNNLQPGEYTLMFQAKDDESQSEIREITIVVTPPWYRSWWANLIWIIIIAGIILQAISYVLSRIRHKQEMIAHRHKEEINEAKLQFFINISHEIRTPMTLIIGPLERLLAEADTSMRPTYTTMHRNAQRIIRLINQLMDIRKIDKGQMHLRFRETDIVGFVDDLMQTFEYQAQKKNITFLFTHEEKELKAWIDLNNFDKVLLNVFSNAFKYTPSGGTITVNLSKGEDKEATGPLAHFFEITVSDTGIGIDKEKIEQIFERFYQINNDLTKSNFGTGIGLHLSRSLVQLHQGTIVAENREEGIGTRFIIRMPLGNRHLKADDLETTGVSIESIAKQLESNNYKNIEEQEHEEGTPKAKAKLKHRILIAEDDDEIRQYIAHELSREFTVMECTNGKEALEIIHKEKIDLIISDIMMPGMDGIALSKKVKHNNNISHIPIVLLTAKSTTEDRIEGMESGADAYLIKPFNIDLLRSTIVNLIENRKRLKGQQSQEQIIEEKLVKIKKKSNDEVLMDKIMKVLNERIADPTLNVESLAMSVGMSRVHLHRKLKGITHTSAKDFIRNIRLQQAAVLLTESSLTVSEAAYSTGFSNLSHFSASFKEFYGMSPTEYKAKKTNQNNENKPEVGE